MASGMCKSIHLDTAYGHKHLGRQVKMDRHMDRIDLLRKQFVATRECNG